MKTQNRNLLIAILAIAFVIPFMSALAISATWNSPANYSNHTGSFSWNCTTAGNVNVTVLNVTIYANSSTGTMTSLGTTTNTSAAQTAWAGTGTITSTLDGTNYNLSCYADNSTDQAYSAEIGCTHVMFDSTDPVCNITKAHSSIAYKGTQELTWDSSDAIERVSTLVTIDRPGLGADLTYSDADRILTLTSQDTKYTGDWTATVLATDRAGNTDTESVTFKSYMPDGAIDEGYLPVQKDNGKAILLILVVAAILYFVFKKN